LTFFKKQANVPYLLVANKADQKGLSCDEIKQVLKLPWHQPVVSCVATDRASVRAVAEHLISLIETRAQP
jgi:signal recognition particle receptor subunit beta